MSDQPTDPTPQPGGTPPADPTPEPSQAELLYSGLQNLDTRSERLNELLRPGQDLPPGMDWNTVRAQAWASHQEQAQEPQFDPFAQIPEEPQLLGYDPNTGQPVFDNQQQYQQPGFDPRSLTPVFESYGEHIQKTTLETLRAEMMQQAQNQGIMQGVHLAADKHKLSDYDKRVVDMLTRDAVKQQPNRAPADIADDIARQHIEAANQHFVSQGGVAPIASGSSAPSGPIPGDDRPKTFAEGLEFSQRPGVMNQRQ